MNHRTSINEFAQETQDKLKYYVYALKDPRTNAIFYVGKGKGNRAFHHQGDDSAREKARVIADIVAAGMQPAVEILTHGLDEQSAFDIEAYTIAVLGRARLTNRIDGRGRWPTRMTAEQIDRLYSLPLSDHEITQPAIAINVNQSYTPDISDEELYHCVRGHWRVAKQRADKARLALAVYRGLIVGVFEIDPSGWRPARLDGYMGRPFDVSDISDRLEFIGRPIRSSFLGKRIKPHGQNPIRYLNC